MPDDELKISRELPLYTGQRVCRIAPDSLFFSIDVRQ